MTIFKLPAQLPATNTQLTGETLPTPSQPAIIRKATLDDLGKIYELYKIVSTVNRGNLTQEEDEITLDYISEVLNQGLERGLILVIEQDNKIIGYLKAFTSPFRSLAHVLTNATMIIHPEYQSAGYGGQILDTYLEEIKNYMPHILRFELLPHESNQRAIQFYGRHKFFQESIAKQKIRHPQGSFEAEVTLVWFNPHFSFDALEKYHSFLQENRLKKQIVYQ